MKLIKVGNRILAGFLALCMLGGEPAVYAAENTDTPEQDCYVFEEELTEEQDVTGNTISVEGDVSDNQRDTEESVSYMISGMISDITSRSATFTVNVTGLQDGESAHVRVKYFCDKENTTYLRTEDLDSSSALEISINDLFADTDYTIEATLYTDRSCTTKLAQAEDMYFHTLPNETNHKAEVTFSNITANSATVNIAPSEEILAKYQELNSYYLSVNIIYGYTGSEYGYLSKYVSLKKGDGYAGSLELTNLYAGTEYYVKVIWPVIGSSGKEVSEYTFTTLNSGIDYTFSVEGDTIGGGIVHFALVSGYDESKEYTVTIYRSDSTGSRVLFDNAILNSENHYTYESTTAVLNQIDVEYSIWVEVTQKTDNGTVNILTTDKITKKIEKTKVFELSADEDSITYITAKIDVNWINKEVIAEEEIRLYLKSDDGYFTTDPITLVKGQKEHATVEFYNLHPGKTYEMIVTVELGYFCYNFEKITFTTKEYNFEPFTEVKSPSKMDIARKWKELGINLDQSDTYERDVNHTDGGLLSQSTLQNALDLTNFIRYVAGLPSDLIYDEEWCSICNAGCELNRLNGKLSHDPEKPDEVSEEFYKRGYKATSSSNIAAGYGSLVSSILGYMADHGESNISKGHRTWILNPALSTLGFGKSQRFYSMYVFSAAGWSHARETTFNKGYYHWPAANMPMEIYTTTDTAYTPSLHLSSEYDSMFADDITVQVVSKKLGKEWTFTGDTGTYSSHCYMRVYDHKLVFSTGLYPKGDEVTVTVTGTTINGEPAPITYTMNFFSIADINVEDIPVESVTVLGNTLEVMEGESIQFTASVLPENATNKKVSWSVESVSGNGQATISSEGVLTGTLEGTVKVTATSKSDSSISDSVLVTVTERNIPLEMIHFSKENLRIEKGNSYYLPAILTPANTTDDEIIYSSQQPEKVTVVNGLIRALEVTQEPVIIKATVGDLHAECLVEVYENAKELPDKNYDTRITDVVMSGNSDISIGETSLIKYYPVTNGQELLASEYEMTITCDEKYLTLTPLVSEDHGCWYELTGVKAGKQKISITVKSKVEGNENPESVTRNFTYVVAEKVDEEAEEPSTAPILVSSNISVNQNTVDGTALDIRLMEGNTNITNVYLTSKKNDGTENLFAITLKNGIYYIQTKEIGANKKYNLIAHIETEQGAWEYPLKVTTKKSFPAVTIKQTVKPNTTLLYENAVFRVISKEAIESVTFTTTSSDFVQVGVEGSGAEYLLTIGQKEHGSKLDKKGIVEIAFAGYRSVYSKTITVSTTSQKVKTNTLTSNTKKVTVNSENGEEIAATLQMGLQNSAEKYPAKIIISSTNSKTAKMLSSKSLHFTYNKNTGVLKVFVKEGTAQGTYKYKITGCILENGAFVATEGSIPLTVTVAAKEPTFTLKASGSIDLIAREQSCVTYTPSIKNIAGCVKTAELEGEDADKFYLRVEETGKIKVYARAYAALFPKTTYILNIKATLDNGYACKPVQVKIKPKQSAFKASAKQSTITLCRSEIKAQPIEIVVKNPLSARIAHVKAVSIPQGMTYDSESQTLQITNNKKVKSGKIYKVTFEVTPAGAHKSIKPAKITIKVKVK